MQDRLQERLRAVWRPVRGIYCGEWAETRARRWWSRRDRETARESLRLIEASAADMYRQFVPMRAIREHVALAMRREATSPGWTEHL